MRTHSFMIIIHDPAASSLCHIFGVFDGSLVGLHVPLHVGLEAEEPAADGAPVRLFSRVCLHVPLHGGLEAEETAADVAGEAGAGGCGSRGHGGCRSPRGEPGMVMEQMVTEGSEVPEV